MGTHVCYGCVGVRFVTGGRGTAALWVLFFVVDIVSELWHSIH